MVVINVLMYICMHVEEVICTDYTRSTLAYMYMYIYYKKSCVQLPTGKVQRSSQPDYR